MDGFVRKGAKDVHQHPQVQTHFTRYQNTGRVDSTDQRAVLPQISIAPGFVSYYAVDDGSGTLATVSVFETQSGAEESNRQAADFTKKNLPALVSGPPEITSGEVLASQTVRSGAKSAS